MIDALSTQQPLHQAAAHKPPEQHRKQQRYASPACQGLPPRLLPITGVTPLQSVAVAFLLSPVIISKQDKDQRPQQDGNRPTDQTHTAQMASADKTKARRGFMLKVLRCCKFRMLHRRQSRPARPAPTENVRPCSTHNVAQKRSPERLSKPLFIVTSSFRRRRPKATIVRLTLKRARAKAARQVHAPFTSASPASTNQTPSPKTLRTQGHNQSAYPRIRKGEFSNANKATKQFLHFVWLRRLPPSSAFFFRTMQSVPMATKRNNKKILKNHVSESKPRIVARSRYCLVRRRMICAQAATARSFVRSG